MKDFQKKNKPAADSKYILLPPAGRPRNINLFISIILLYLLIVIIELSSCISIIKNRIEELALYHDIPYKPLAYPVLKDYKEPMLSAATAAVVDNKSQVVLYKKNPQLRFPMASTTKIMTALVALEHFQDDDPITIKQENVEGVNIGYAAGDQISFIDVLYSLLLSSGNDAAFAIADNFPGGRTEFVKRMNEKAGELSLKYTAYEDPAGLEDDGDFTTSVDLARLASYALSDPLFAKIVGTKKKIIFNTDGTKTFYLYNLNKLLGQNGINGVKTGTTAGAGEVLVTSRVDENNNQYIIVVMKSANRYSDTLQLLNLINNNVDYIYPVVK